jgi:hypothetical protein
MLDLNMRCGDTVAENFDKPHRFIQCPALYTVSLIPLQERFSLVASNQASNINQLCHREH